MRISLGIPLTESLCRKFSIDKRKCNQIFVLIVTFLAYVVYRMSRRSISIVKPELDHENCTKTEGVKESIGHGNDTDWCDWEPFNHSDSKMLLGWLDTSYLLTYALFTFVAGYVADRCDLRYFLTISLFVCGIFCILFGIAYPLHIHNYYYFVAVQVFTGIVQSTGLPSLVAAVANWFGSSKKGLIFGIWSWHTSVGTIIGSVVAGMKLSKITFCLLFYRTKLF